MFMDEKPPLPGPPYPFMILYLLSEVTDVGFLIPTSPPPPLLMVLFPPHELLLLKGANYSSSTVGNVFFNALFNNPGLVGPRVGSLV